MDEVVVAVEHGEGGAEEVFGHFDADAEDVAPQVVFEAEAAEVLAEDEEALVGEDDAIGPGLQESGFLVGNVEDVFVAAEDLGDLLIDFGNDFRFLALVHGVLEGFFEFEDFVEGMPVAKGLVVDEVAAVELALVEEGEELI